MASQLAKGICDVALTTAYWAAILLTGSSRLAEGVVRAIKSMNIDAAASQELLRLTVTASMKIMPSAEQAEATAGVEGYANLLCCADSWRCRAISAHSCSISIPVR
jgi:hypothetical protein